MRKFYSFLLLLGQFATAQQWKNFDKVKWNAQSFYLITRATDSKIPLIAEQFNTSDWCSTHVGIGIVDKEQFKIFHVTNLEKDSPSAVVRESIESFIDLPDATYLSIWECTVGDALTQQIREVLSSYFKKKIAFDYDFNAEDDEQMYCSEFCVKVLRDANTPFDFKTVEKPLGDLYGSVLGRPNLIYWPVDFFQKDSRFHKIYESWLNRTGY